MRGCMICGAFRAHALVAQVHSCCTRTVSDHIYIYFWCSPPPRRRRSPSYDRVRRRSPVPYERRRRSPSPPPRRRRSPSPARQALTSASCIPMPRPGNMLHNTLLCMCNAVWGGSHWLSVTCSKTDDVYSIKPCLLHKPTGLLPLDHG